MAKEITLTREQVKATIDGLYVGFGRVAVEIEEAEASLKRCRDSGLHDIAKSCDARLNVLRAEMAQLRGLLDMYHGTL